MTAGSVRQASPVTPGCWEITDAEFERAKAEARERFGDTLPPVLQRVIDRGGRFARSGNRARIEEEF
jgi:hypothetical protein